MFRVYSFISSTIAFLYSIISFFYYHDDYGWEINFYNTLTNAIFILLTILFILKVQARWQTIWAARQIKGFQITRKGWGKSMVNELMSVFILVFTGLMIWLYIKENILIPLIYMCFFIESILNITSGRKHFKLIINSNVLFIITNKHKIYYWKDVKAFIQRHNGLIIQLKNGLQTHVNQNDFKDYKDWLEKLHLKAMEKEIYWE